MKKRREKKEKSGVKKVNPAKSGSNPEVLGTINLGKAIIYFPNTVARVMNLVDGCIVTIQKIGNVWYIAKNIVNNCGVVVRQWNNQIRVNSKRYLKLLRKKLSEGNDGYIVCVIGSTPKFNKNGVNYYPITIS